MALKLFDKNQLDMVSRAISAAEELVSGYYKLSGSEWGAIRYDFITMADLSESEIVKGPLAEILRYNARPNDSIHTAENYDFYKICVQDQNILELMEANQGLDPFSFFLYIAAHELVHIVRFSRFFQNFEATQSERLAEEKKVHEITREILLKINFSGMKQILDFYDLWQYRV